MRGPTLLGLLLTLAACAAPNQPRPACPAPGLAATELRLYFGLSRPGGLVGEAEWQDFLDEVVSPAFPDGLTVLDGEGRWLDPQAGRSIAEPSKIVVLYVIDRAAIDQRVATVVTRYKDRFHQQSVLSSERPACIAFR